jgi:oxygen-dependent protoporphyrinogen oxidase
MRALYPGYFNLERKFGSLSAGMQSAPHPSSAKQAPFLSFRDGMETLPKTLASRLTRTRIRLNTAVSHLDSLGADHVLVAVPANHATSLLSPFPEITRTLGQIEHRSSAIVSFGFARAQISHSLNGTGFLVPPSTDLPVTGATWSSRKWAGRAPDDRVLIRVFLGGDREQLALRSDEDLQTEALQGIATLLGISGPPACVQVNRWNHALPQYNVGHLDLMRELESAVSATGSLTLAGTSYGGVGVPDSMRQGLEAAEKIAQNL